MKLPILLIFVFAMIYCFEICDGADDDARGVIIEIKKTVTHQINTATNFCKEQSSAMAKQLNQMVLDLRKTMKIIVDSYTLEILKYVEAARPVKKHVCVTPATEEMKAVNKNLIQQFQEYIELVQAEITKCSSKVPRIGNLLIQRCERFLSNTLDENLLALIEAKYIIFEHKVTAENLMITFLNSVANETSFDRADQLKKDLIEESSKREKEVKACVDKHNQHIPPSHSQSGDNHYRG